MKISSENFNKLMIAIGSFIVILMVLSSGLSGYQHTVLEKQCLKGDINVCTQLIESKKLSKGELTVDYGVRGYYYAKKGAFDQALADLNEAIALSPSQAGLYAGRAN